MPSAPRRVARLFAVVAALVVLVDQATKAYAVATWAQNPVDLGIVRLVAVRNPNAAFSLPGFPGMFLIVTVIVFVLVIRALPRAPSLAAGLAYGLVVGGALGNAVDRALRTPGFPSGAVVDWIDLGWFPVFNAADSAITVGAGLLVLLLSRAEHDQPAAATAQEAQNEQ
jgi:signal peptidase II